MDTWTLQMGYPVVNVTNVNQEIVLTQQRFLSSPDANLSNTIYTSDYGYVYRILYLSLHYILDWLTPTEVI